MLDVSIYVLKRFRLPNGDYKLKIMWLDSHGGSLNLRDSVRVGKLQLPNWKWIPLV